MKKLVKNIVFFMFGVMASIGFLTASAYSNGSARFFESLYDVPIMPGLEEMPDYALVFDKPEGRVAEAAAYSDGGLPPSEILKFYKTSLQELGWTQKAPAVYVREGEKLTISSKTQGGQNMVLFLLEPQ